MPPYEQIKTAIATAVRRRELAAGAQLPTVRQLARDLEVSPATVSHAYRELERDGVVYGAGRKGTFIAEVQDSLPALAEEFVAAALKGGADRDAILHAVVDALPKES